MTLESVVRDKSRETSGSISSLDIIQETAPKLSIIIPVYNCEHKIEKSIKYLSNVLEHIEDNYELIVIDDGSNDSTAAVIKQLSIKDPRIKLSSYKPNMGKGYAVKQGVSLSKGENIIFIDGDCDIKPTVLAAYLNELKHADLVVASKYHHDSNVDAPLLRRVLSLGFNSLVRMMLGIEIMDTQAGLKAARAGVFKRIFDKVLVKRFAFDVEMLAIATLIGCRIEELPINIELKNQFSIRAMVRMFLDIAGIAYRLRVLKWYQLNLENRNAQYRPLIPC